MSKFNKRIESFKKKDNAAKGLVLGAAIATIVASGSSAPTDSSGDKLVIVGNTTGSNYTAADLANIAGTGVDISSAVTVEQANSNTVQTVSSGETIDGGTGGKVLYAFGKVDFTGITLTNITKIYMDNEIVISDASLHSSGITELFGTGSIKADTGLLDLDGIIVPTGIDIKDSAGNIIVPEVGAGALGAKFTLAENTTAVGHFTVTDASAVGTVTYVLSGADAAKFSVDANGVISFVTAPDFEIPTDQGADNIYDLTITATDEHGKSTSQTLAITVTDAADASVELSTLNGALGLRLDGAAVGDKSGWSVSGIGDFNGDGIDDIVIGAFGVNGNTGASYVVFGKTSGFGNVDLGTLNNADGFKLNGATASDYSGNVSSAGDVNGDGFDDIIISAYNANSDTGASYVVFGKASGFSTINLGSLGADGFRLDGAAINDESGVSISSAGDVNGDGFDDLIIGARGANSNEGSSYVVFGMATSFSTIDLGNLGVNGFRLDGASASHYSGSSVSSAGDVNGDGYDDLIIGAPGVDGFKGSAYVVFGKASGFVDVELGNLGAAGFTLNGVATGDSNGWSVSSAGDVNGDGFDDIIFSAFNTNNGSGSSYVVFGKASGFSTIELGSLNSVDGFRLDGVVGGDNSGISVSSAGDFNGDGFDDIIIGARAADPNGDGSGSSYVIFGNASGFTNINLGDLNGADGFRLDGVAEGDRSGTSVSSAGDVNGDGYDDLIIGASRADPNSVNGDSGASYIMYGGGLYAANDAVATANNDALVSTVGADTIDGLAGDDVIRAGADDDIITGGAGADRMYGGGGSDKFVFSAGDSKVVISGSGDNGEISGYDIIEDFKVGDGAHNSETFEIVGASLLLSNGFFNLPDSTLTIGGQTIKSMSITNGVASFDDQDSFGFALEISTEGEIAAVVEFLQINSLSAQGVTVAFDVGADTFIFSQGTADGLDNDQDILVRLEDVQVDGIFSSASNGAGDLFLL